MQNIWNDIICCPAVWDRRSVSNLAQAETHATSNLHINFKQNGVVNVDLAALSLPQDAPVKLCDFGFAKIDQGDLMTPQFTPYYVAPQVEAQILLIQPLIQRECSQ